MTYRANNQNLLICSLLCLTMAACTAEVGSYPGDPVAMPKADPEQGEGEEFSPFTLYSLPVGATVEVCKVKWGLNNRSGPSTGYMVLRVLKKGTKAVTLARSGSWYRLDIQGKIGWSYGKYLCTISSSAPSPSPTPSPSPGNCHSGSKFGWTYCSSSCPCGEGEGDCDRDSECQSGLTCVHNVGTSYGVTNSVDVCQKSAAPPPTPPTPSPAPSPSPGGSSGKIDVSRDGIINACKAFVGFSYWWGGARFKVGSKDYGKCLSVSYSGHSGKYGSDCSGFASKVWQLPPAMPFDKSLHPYSTWTYYGQKIYWSHISRGDAKRADAMVYRKSSSGHILIYEKGDPWGSAWTYEARSCSLGVVHNLRTISSSYRARRRHGL